MKGWNFTGHCGILIAVTLFMTQSAWCQVARINLDVLRFQTTSEPYVEVQLDLPSSLLHVQNTPLGWCSQAEVTTILEQNGEVVTYTKGHLNGPVCADSMTAVSGSQFHVDRLAARVGAGRVTVEIKGHPDMVPVSAAVDVHLSPLDIPHFSTAMLVEAFSAAEPNSPFAHSGVDLLPIVGAEVEFEAPEMRYYLELYGVEHLPDETIYIANWLENAEGMELQGSRVYQRVNRALIVPIFQTRPWGQGASASRYVVWEALTKTGESLCLERLPLTVGWNGAVSEEVAAFARAWTDREALLRHLQDHQPRANPSQQRLIKDVLPGASLVAMQSFLDRFWHLANPEDPEAAYREYVKNIAYVDERWGACYNGHGADSEMGYVYLRYGKPTTVVQRHNETEYYPYEIWHYYRAGNFSDKRFLFYSPHMVAECFRLLHSDMLGEVSNQDWLTILRNRENNLRVTESQENRSNPRDTYTREEPEDLFYNPR